MTFRLDLPSTAAVVASLVALSLAGACGGRSRTLVESDDDTQGAGASNAGANSVGSAGGPGVGHAGAPGIAGASGVAGGPAGECDNVRCVNPVCGPDSKLVTVAGTCCPICQPVCTPAQGCPAIACANGTHAESLPGACCPACVADTDVSCNEGMTAYAQARAQLLQKFQHGCASDAECVVVAPFNQCENGCQYTPVWTFAAKFLADNLESYAAENCASCMVGPIPPCAPPSPVRCVMGQCTFASLN